jgi:hypothetical protein
MLPRRRQETKYKKKMVWRAVNYSRTFDFREGPWNLELTPRENRGMNACVKHDKDWNEEMEVIEKYE